MGVDISPHKYTNMKLIFTQQFIGSSFVSPAYGWSGTRATINYDSPAAEKKSGEARKQAGKKKKGCGENEFLPACFPPKAEWGGKTFPQFLRQQEGKTEKFSFP